MTSFWVEAWNALPGIVQFGLSRLLSAFFNTRFSHVCITPFIRFHFGDVESYLKSYSPPKGNSYKTFQDFFIRKKHIELKGNYVCPADGLVADVGPSESYRNLTVKGQKCSISTIFGETIPERGYFLNIFLHNKDYHRVHSPCSGRVIDIKNIRGNLFLLRPWFYPSEESFPAFLNERVVVKILDDRQKTWFVSLVGGPLVATIEVAKEIGIGAQVLLGQELGHFQIGSTCCVHSPYQIYNLEKNQEVEVGSQLELKLNQNPAKYDFCDREINY